MMAILLDEPIEQYGISEAKYPEGYIPPERREEWLNEQRRANELLRYLRSQVFRCLRNL